MARSAFIVQEPADRRNPQSVETPDGSGGQAIAIRRDTVHGDHPGFGAGKQAGGRPAPHTGAQDEQSSPFADQI